MVESKFYLLFYGEVFAPSANRSDFDTFKEAKEYAIQAFGGNPEAIRNTEIIEFVGTWKGPDFSRVDT